MRGTSLLALAVAVPACSSDVLVARQIPAEQRDNVTAIADGNNQFACDLYRELSVDQPNLVFSPFSIATALSMLDAGAAGTTHDELRTALHVTLPDARVAPAYHALLDSLATGGDYDNYELATANRLFVQRDFPLLPAYLDTTREHFGAEAATVDFQRDSVAATQTINDWVADQTDGRITDLLGGLDPVTRLVIVNAIAFSGTWQTAFDPNETKSGPFVLADYTTVAIPLMHRHDTMDIAYLPGGVLGSFPFAGRDLSLVVVVPSLAGGLPALEAQLSATNLREWLAQRTPSEVDITLPRFSSRTMVEAKEALQRLGIVQAFSDGLSDLSGIDGKRDLYVSRVAHQAMIAVNEAGAEAAAATAVVVVVRSANAFSATQPFVYFIYDEVTGSILFMGRLTAPAPS